jgi:hypothetical protein
VSALTAEEKKGLATVHRIARECRRLAGECVEGKAPPFIVGNYSDGLGGHCAFGWALARVARDRDPWSAWWAVVPVRDLPASAATAEAREAMDLVFAANNTAPDNERHARVVFPLLWVADALDAAAIALAEPARPEQKPGPETPKENP